MTWPITDSIEEVKKYNVRAPCGCWYRILGHEFKRQNDETLTLYSDIDISPYRMQRCFKHMKISNSLIEIDIQNDLQRIIDENCPRDIDSSSDD